MLCLVTDLIFATKIASTASSMGVAAKTVRSLEKFEQRLAEQVDRTVLVDLNADGVDVLAAIERCRNAANPPHIIAYASHVQADLIQAARNAGAHEVMARSAFVNKLPAILAAEADEKGQKS